MQINEHDFDGIYDIISRYIDENYTLETREQLIKEGRTSRELINKVKKDFLEEILKDEGMWSLLQLQFFEGNAISKL
jgi:hypothetical protein